MQPKPVLKDSLPTEAALIVWLRDNEGICGINSQVRGWIAPDL
jgi:hypothetical protein